MLSLQETEKLFREYVVLNKRYFDAFHISGSILETVKYSADKTRVQYDYRMLVCQAEGKYVVGVGQVAKSKNKRAGDMKIIKTTKGANIIKPEGYIVHLDAFENV